MTRRLKRLAYWHARFLRCDWCVVAVSVLLGVAILLALIYRDSCF